MAYDVRVIPIKEFLRTDVSGVIDLQASRALLKELLAICSRNNVHHILIDGREASSRSSTVDVWTLANDLGSLGVTRSIESPFSTVRKTILTAAPFLSSAQRIEAINSGPSATLKVPSHG